jgi:hypothetical protein
MITRIDSYINDKGMTIEDHVIVDPPDSTTKNFIGRALIAVRNEAGQVVGQREIEFSIKADDIKGAFAAFEDAAKAEMDKVRQEAREKAMGRIGAEHKKEMNKIAIATQMPESGSKILRIP